MQVNPQFSREGYGPEVDAGVGLMMPAYSDCVTVQVATCQSDIRTMTAVVGRHCARERFASGNGSYGGMSNDAAESPAPSAGPGWGREVDADVKWFRGRDWSGVDFVMEIAQ